MCQCVSVSVEVSVFKGFSGRTLRSAFGNYYCNYIFFKIYIYISLSLSINKTLNTKPELSTLPRLTGGQTRRDANPPAAPFGAAEGFRCPLSKALLRTLFAWFCASRSIQLVFFDMFCKWIAWSRLHMHSHCRRERHAGSMAAFV